MYISKQLSLFSALAFVPWSWIQLTVSVSGIQLQNLNHRCRNYCIANQNQPYDVPCNRNIYYCRGVCSDCRSICEYLSFDFYIRCPDVDELEANTTTTSTASSPISQPSSTISQSSSSPSISKTKRPVHQVHEHQIGSVPPDSLHGNKKIPEDEEDADADEGSEAFAVIVRILIFLNFFATIACLVVCFRFFKRSRGEPATVAPTATATTTQIVINERSQPQSNPLAKKPTPPSEPEPALPKAKQTTPEPAPLPPTQQFPPYPWPPMYQYPPPYAYAPYYPPPQYGLPYYSLPPPTAPPIPPVQDASTPKRNSLQPATTNSPRVPEPFSPRRDSVPPPMPTQSVIQLNENREPEGRSRRYSGSSGRGGK